MTSNDDNNIVTFAQRVKEPTFSELLACHQECLDDLVANRGCDHEEAIAVFDAFVAMTESMKKLKTLIGDDFALDLVESAIVGGLRCLR
jgi:hypothetical protein